MKFTTQEIRGAILKTAALFETKPHLWDWNNCNIPDCGTPGCAIGYIGYHLGINKGALLHDVATAIGATHPEQDSRNPFYARMSDLYGHKWRDGASNAAAALRAYANKYFPAEQVEESKQLVRWSDCIWQPKAVA